ncbi:MAG: hypothetical protein IT376_11730 [Polyangiaceae bacterium]|nr:hypothetical protein [Polyangiaceae bacterium]
MVAPPSSRRPTSGDPGLEEARGVIRDFVGALTNLEGLLGSPRVGPRALSALLPGVYAGCTSVRSAFVVLVDAVAATTAAAAGAELRESVGARLEALERALESATRAPAAATARLALERAIRRSAPELEHARALAELLALAQREQRALVAPGLLLRDALGSPEAASGAQPALLRWSGVDDAWLPVGTFVRLVELAAPLATWRAGPSSAVRLRVSLSRAGDHLVARFEPAPATASGEPIFLPRAPSRIEPAEGALAAACGLLGGALERRPDAVSVSLVARPLAGAAGAG